MYLSRTLKMNILCYLVQMSWGRMNWYGLPFEVRVPHLHSRGGVESCKNNLCAHETTVVGAAFN